MPRYSTTTSIYTMLPGLVATSTNDSLIQQHADRVGGMIDSYVGRWYAVSGWTTASSTPQSVQLWSDALTAQLTMRSKFTADGQNKNEWVKELADQAIKDLEGIRDRELIIIDSTGTEASLATVSALVTATRHRYTPIFDVDSELNWKVDPDLKTQIESERD